MSEDPRSEQQKVGVAIPVKMATLERAHISLQDLPVAHFEEAPAPAQAPAPVKRVVERTAKPQENNFRKMAEPSEAEREQAASERTPAFQQPPAPQEKESSINRKALKATNRGVHPSSRRFIRGILHPSPVKVIVVSLLAIVVRVTFLAAIVLGVLLLLDKVNVVFAWALLALPVVALFHFAMVGKVRCRVCGIKEYVPSAAHKHVKTHRFLFFGPIVSTALHLLVFKWFHCMFCGTAVRIKK